MWLVIQLFACGGGAELQQPHDPPEWPMRNIRVIPESEVVPPSPPKPDHLRPKSDDATDEPAPTDDPPAAPEAPTEPAAPSEPAPEGEPTP